MVPIVIYFPQNSYMVENIDPLLLQFEAAGLIQFWASDNVNNKYLTFNFESSGPKKLTVEHLYGSFQLLAAGLIILVITFLFELFWIMFRKRLTSHIQIKR